jgi:hypothetical protein
MLLTLIYLQILEYILKRLRYVQREERRRPALLGYKCLGGNRGIYTLQYGNTVDKMAGFLN